MGNIRAILTYLGEFLIYMILQVFIFQDLILFNNAFCFVYILPLITLPNNFPPVLFMILGFLSGLTIDIFYDTPGMHAAATVLLTFLKPHLIGFLNPGTDYEDYHKTTLPNTGFKFFGTLTILLVFIHHSVLFSLEAAEFNLFWSIIQKTLYSTVFTFMIVILIQNLIYLPRRRSRSI